MPAGLNPIDRSARRAVHRRLSRLRSGAVELSDPAGSATLGDTSSGIVRVDVRDARLYRRMLLGGSLGVADAYLDGMWETDDLTGLLRSFVRDIALAHDLQRGAGRLGVALGRLAHRLRRNTRTGSRRNIAEHYDLGNDFFSLFLDDTMTYSCGVFETPESGIREAQVEKLDRICRKLELGPDDRVVEIGAGWGSFAIHAARTRGCRVTTTTISREQHALATSRVREAGLEDRVTVLLEDYRELPGKMEGAFDALVSIEMIEAVGHEFLGDYFDVCSRLLEPHGRALIQAITMPDERYPAYLRSVDFIQRYVFPGSCCPAPGAIAEACERSSDLRLTGDEDLTLHYAETLRRWRERFFANLDGVRALGYPERFIRMWEYYLCYCEAGFAERYIGLRQLEYAKPARRSAAERAEVAAAPGASA